MTYKRYPNISFEEEQKIRRDAEYSGMKGGAEIVLQQIQREREQIAAARAPAPTHYDDRLNRWRR